MDYLKKYYNLIFSPNNFPYGKEVKEIKLKNYKEKKTILKKFRENKIDKYIKAIFFMEKLNNYDFIAKKVNRNDKELELEQIYCGKQLRIKNLPKDWKEQLIKN